MEGRYALIDILIHLSIVDGYIHPNEVKIIQEITEYLSLDVNRIHNKIFSLQNEADDFSTFNTNESKDKSGYTLPQIVDEGKKLDENKLRMDLVERKNKQTIEVQSILAEVFEEDEFDVEIGNQPQIVSDDNGIDNLMNNIDARHKELLRVLMHKNTLTYKDFDDLCKKNNLFTEGAIEIVNECSFKLFEDDFIDLDNDIVTINLDILEQ